jgi:hypothetical protein
LFENERPKLTDEQLTHGSAEFRAPKSGTGTQLDAPGYKLLEWDGERWNAFEKEFNQWYPAGPLTKDDLEAISTYLKRES